MDLFGKILRKNRDRGLTLIELLIVIVILTLLFTLLYILLDPLAIIAEARNSRRWSDVNSISTAIHRYILEYNDYPPGITNEEKQLGTATGGCNEVCGEAKAACLNLEDDLKIFLREIPFDPLSDNSEKTYYSVIKDANNIITVKACNAENGVQIQISR